MPHADEKPMTVGEHPQCDPIKTRIIHVGMGASGMLAAHKAKRMLKNYELVCYEKNESPGGTWWENSKSSVRKGVDQLIDDMQGILGVLAIYL